MFDVAGISISDEKEELVRARLMTRLRELKISRYEDYLARIEHDPLELSNMVDVLTTNLTSFLREQQHFDFLSSEIFPRWRMLPGPFQIWSAGCSTGEEPYSIAMRISEELPRASVRILATDLSLRVLRRAKAGVFSEKAVESLPSALRGKYLCRVPGAAPATYAVKPELKAMVAFARLNLMGPWPMRGPFDLIFCRNVMIYFNDDTRTTLACRFAEMLGPEGYLFIGHSESLTSLQHPLQLILPAIYTL